ncbi:hypothetical protein [Prochlorococcus marinus]|uniref:Glycine zipper 2TM domain-containing protein n=1 Tax=Prochlorococcus marinus str. P0902-H212 TaxID=1620696 RepID=A0A0D5A2W4_PROMR|nr:hypothetical protein [Prochlorococcus marinus]AJW30531.1 hypothetical protein FA02_0265 [Prochlorococcus marinus str. P0902-H212]
MSAEVFVRPAFGKWSNIKAKGETNSIYKEGGSNKCISKSQASIFGAALGGIFGNKISGGKRVGTAAGIATGAFIGGLLSGCNDSSTIIALSEPVYKYPERWSEVKARGWAIIKP